MKHRQHFVTLALATTLALSAAQAGEIYRYVDDNGEVHYVDRPTGAPSEQRLAISSSPTDPAAVQARTQRRYSQTSADAMDARQQDSDDAADDMTRAERRQVAAERARKCDEYRQRLETYVSSRRLYRETDDGEREYLDEDERLEARARVEDLIEQTCSG